MIPISTSNTFTAGAQGASDAKEALNGNFDMFRRAKLMLNRIDSTTIGTALDTGSLVAHIDLTGGDGGPRCARVDPPAIAWSTSRP